MPSGMLIFPELLLSTFVFASQPPGALKSKLSIFGKVNLLDGYLLFTGWRGKAAELCVGTPSQRSSYLFWQRFSG